MSGDEKSICREAGHANPKQLETESYLRQLCETLGGDAHLASDENEEVGRFGEAGFRRGFDHCANDLVRALEHLLSENDLKKLDQWLRQIHEWRYRGLRTKDCEFPPSPPTLSE